MKHKYSIEKGVPLPFRSKYKDIHDKLRVKDSVFFENRLDGINFMNHMYRRGYAMCSRTEKKGIRVWRLS